MEQIGLTQQDIDEHYEFICREYCIDPKLPGNEWQNIADEMIERFIETFLE